MAKASARSMPRAAFCSGGWPSARSECQSVSEPCGSASSTRQRRPAAWAQAARCAVSVLLPAPPLREASVMTFMAPLPDWGAATLRPRWLTNGYRGERAPPAWLPYAGLGMTGAVGHVGHRPPSLAALQPSSFGAMVRHRGGASRETEMGLLDILASIQTGGTASDPRARSAPGPASASQGMSPIAKAMLALLALYAVKHARRAGSPPTQPDQRPGGGITAGNPGGGLAGGLGDLLGGILGGGRNSKRRTG